MPTSASAKKRVRQSEKRRLRNRSVRSNLRSNFRKVLEAIEAKDADAATKAYREMESRIDKAARKGVIHKNTAARKKARLAKRLQAITAG